MAGDLVERRDRRNARMKAQIDNLVALKMAARVAGSVQDKSGGSRMNLPRLFEFDDWLYVAQCLRWIPLSNDRARKIADRIEEMLRQDNAPSSLDCTPTNPCHHCSECSK